MFEPYRKLRLESLGDYQRFTEWACKGYTFEDCEDDPKRISHELAYNLIGLNEEAGEAAGKVKKAIRRMDMDSFADDLQDPEQRKKFLHELGDTLYYLTRCADMVGSDLEEVANLNKEKLEDRHARGVVKGEGDDR